MTDYGILAPAWAATGAADLVDDNAVLSAMLATEVALAEAQAELGVIPAGAAVAIRAAAVPAHIDLAAVAAGVRETANPVVAFVEQLSEVNVDGVEPMTSVMPMEMKKRPDVVNDGEIPDDVVKNAPATEDHFFLVPKVVE